MSASGEWCCWPGERAGPLWPSIAWLYCSLRDGAETSLKAQRLEMPRFWGLVPAWGAPGARGRGNDLFANAGPGRLRIFAIFGSWLRDSLLAAQQREAEITDQEIPLEGRSLRLLIVRRRLLPRQGRGSSCWGARRLASLPPYRSVFLTWRAARCFSGSGSRRGHPKDL